MKRRPQPPALAPAPRFSPAWALAALFLAVHVALGVGFIRSAAPTYDESVHLASGYSYLATGRFRLNIMDHPPLAEMWGAAPLLLWRPNLFLSNPDWLMGRLYHYSDTFVNKNNVPGARMLNAGRLFCLLSWTLLLGWALLWWAERLGGKEAAAASAFAFAFTPMLISNLSLLTTDGASAVFFFLVFWLLSFEQRPFAVWASAGACAGLALASKFNMIIIGPLAAVMLFLDWRARLKPRPPFPWGGAAVAAASAALALAAVYRFRELPLYFSGLSATLSRLGQGRSAFLHGSHSTTGFALYFPIALLIKTPLPILAAGLGTAALWALKRDRERLWVIGPMAGYFLAALTSKVQIGARHLLPMIPFLALSAGCGLAALWRKAPWGKASAALLGLWAAVSVLRVQPFQLAYFNELIGGPDNGWRWLVDSNLDWGQDLKTLASELKGMGGPPIYFSYFGTADPSAYGIRYVPVAFTMNIERAGDDVDPAKSGRALFAVSATNLQSVYFADKTFFDWLKARKPLKVLGRSMFLYDLSGDLEGRRHLSRLLEMTGRPGAAKSLLLQ
ncbi:MAG: glycosyltransferase family 39 protein [Elusimicrobia bacterium]|nr:glycosyltransferase family 39 protein [Elusimicrobiota bacterium]